MRPSDPVALLEPWIAARLRSLASARDLDDVGQASSDHDLNPGMSPASAPLVEAAVLVPLVERPQGLSVLLTRRADTLRRHTGQVAFAGGRTDPGETAVACALREAHEEIGLEPRFVRPVGLGDAHTTGSGFRITPVVAFVSPGFRLAPHAAEVAEVFEPPFAWLMDPANHDVREASAPDGATRRFYAMPWEGRLIWGATAGMIRTLRARLFAEV